MTGFQFLAGAMTGLLLCHHVEASSGAHPASYPMDTGHFNAGGKVAGA